MARVKRKGAYEYLLGWHQDAGALVVPKVAEMALVDGVNIRQTVEAWPDIDDFMMRVKVPRSGYLQWHDGGWGDGRVQNTTRYYVAQGGKSLTKWLPPTKTKPDKWRSFAIESGWKVQVCNDKRDATLPIHHDYYVQAVEALVMGMK